MKAVAVFDTNVRVRFQGISIVSLADFLQSLTP
jgi:hypothetical protein